MKRVWDFVFPVLGGVAIATLLLLWPKIASPYSEKGFLAGLQNLYAILGGFFVAALTLVATAETESLKQRMIGAPPITFGQERHPLERRRFLSLLFGYLAFSSFALYAIGFLAMLIAPGLRDIAPSALRPVLSGIFLFGYGAWLSHLVTSTLVGLYYFTDRLNRPDPTIQRRGTTTGSP